ncbi:MAG: hypothetical protein AAGH70_02590 [Pseudomonadota bacterium]
MKRLQSQSGEEWDMVWGVGRPEKVLEADLGCEGPFKSLDVTEVFIDPLYPDETKRLFAYSAANGARVVMGEVSNGVWAVGVRRS